MIAISRPLYHVHKRQECISDGHGARHDEENEHGCEKGVGQGGDRDRRLGEGGRFVALSSSVIAKNMPGYGPYIASKAGVEGLVRVFANELRGRGITVNAVAPGPIATDMFFEGKSDALIEQIVKQAPLERIGEPDDIAGVVAFLAGRDGAWVNAQVVRANGGFA